MVSYSPILTFIPFSLGTNFFSERRTCTNCGPNEEGSTQQPGSLDRSSIVFDHFDIHGKHGLEQEFISARCSGFANPTISRTDRRGDYLVEVLDGY
jgi:hypothetical protein